MGRFLVVVGLLSLPMACNNDAEFVCERLTGCGCLAVTESVDACAQRVEDGSARQLDLCATCLEGHDYLCHELASAHAVCGGCTDQFATPGIIREPPPNTSGAPTHPDEMITCVQASSDESGGEAL